MQQNRLIFHVDINSYFATLHQQEIPSLRGRPVGIIKDVGRTCIIAASKEAKLRGVSTGARVPEAKKHVPDLVLVPAHFGIMLSATRKLKEVFQAYSPIVDIFSLDEAFLDLTGAVPMISQRTEDMGGGSKEQILAYARQIQASIQTVLGDWVTCNVGIAHNKLLAKMAGEIAPKGSIFWIDETNLDSVLASVVFKDVCGVGWGLQRKLEILGVHHPLEINLLDDATLLTHFGPYWSKELRSIGKGEETLFFSRPRKVLYQQSVGRTITGYRLCSDETVILRTLRNLMEEAAAKLRAMDLVGRSVGISLSGHDASWGKHKRLQRVIRHSNDLWEVLYHHLYCQWHSRFPVIRYGVYIGDCMPLSDVPISLLQEWRQNEKVYRMVDAVNQRFGSFSLMPARLLGGAIIRPEVTGYLGDKIYLGL